MNQKLAKIRIILVEPAGALNVGSIARVMKNLALSQLILVNPHCDHLGEEARRMAVHGLEVLENARVTQTLPEALEGVKKAIATTARVRAMPIELELPSAALPWLFEDNLESGLIFGPEDRGLSNLELNYAQRFVSIPSNPEYPSLNLAQSVAICLYELFKSVQSQEIVTKTITENLASLDLLEAYYQHLETVLLDIGYLYPHTAKARMEKLRRFFNRSSPTSEEIAMLRGVLRQIEWFKGTAKEEEMLEE
jgi:tRNA/rRNA methyltransferase